MLHLIDSSAWISGLRGKRNGNTGTRIYRILYENTAAICPVIMLEVLSGAVSIKEYNELLNEFNSLHEIPITDEIWNASYTLGYELGRKGVNVPATDVLIAAAAINNKCVLVHCDKHFELIARHTNLKTISV